MPRACPVEEKRRRMQLLREVVKEHSVQRWMRSFMNAIPAAVDRKSNRDTGRVGIGGRFGPCKR